MKKRLLAIAMTLAMTLSLLPASALAAEPTPADKAPTASGTNFFANGTPITITASKPTSGTAETFDGFTAAGIDAYISWDDDDGTKYVGVSSTVTVWGGADGSSSAVSVANTSINMTGGTVNNILGGNFGKDNATADGCSAVNGNVDISISGGTVTNLIYGGGENNTCVNGTVTITLDNVTLGERCYVNGGVLGHGTEGVRNIEEGTMTTYAVVNKVVIDATDSKAYVFGGGGSGSTKVVEAVVTLNNCTVDYLYASGINGEMEKSSLKATDCTITGELAATNRGFIKKADVTLEKCVVELLMTGATTGCFETDSGKPDGSGITGSVLWTIDDQTKVTAARLTPLAKRDANDQTTATLDNITVEKSGEPLDISVAEFTPHSQASVKTFLVSETGTLTLKNVKATVEVGQTLTNVGTINMDATSKLTVDTGATFGQLGTVNGTVDGDGTINNNYVARIGTNGYASLQDAVNAVSTTEPTTITLLKDASGNGVIVPSNKNIIFDLNNCTYDIDGDTVGSSGTETNGFQLLKDSTVTFKNGKITSDKAKILIQNYSNLTLDKVTLDGKNLNDNVPYTLSNNCGNVVIKDSTIIAKDGGCAFDVYYWPDGGYEEGVSVTVEGGSVITGKIEYGGDKTTGSTNVAEHASLNIEGGTFTGELSLGQIGTSSKAGINITGGTFSKDVSDYVQPGMMQDSGGNIVINTETAVAQVGSVGYTTLAAAVAAAEDSDTITMLKEYDATREGTITFNADKDVTLDLGGYELTLFRFDLVRGWLTVKNGSVKCDPTDGQAFNVYAGPTAAKELYTKLVIEKDVTINAAYGICLFPGSNKAGYSSAIEVYGKIESGGIFVSGNLGNDKATATAMAGSGKIPTVTIHEGAVVNNGSEGQGIAMNGLANVTVEGGTISGSEAIGVKRGTLTVEGGTFISNGDYVDPAEANHNGTENTGATISITSTYNYAGTINVNLNGGTFTSEKAPAVYLGHSEEKISGGQTTSSNVYAEGVTLNIQGGTFTSPDNAPTVYVAAKADGDADTYTQQVISGGTFSQDLSESEYLKDDVKYQVSHTNETFSYAETLADAQKLAQPGDDITYLADEQELTFTLTLKYNYGDTKDSVYTVASGTEITLPEPARSGYTFTGWFDGSETYNAGDSVTISADTTFTAQWSYNGGGSSGGSTRYTVTAPTNVANGSVKVSPTRASRGQTVTITVTPDEGYELASLAVYDADGDAVSLTDAGNGKYTFTMPRSKVTVEAAFAEAEHVCPAGDFADVSQSAWYHAAVDYVLEQGIMSGVSADRFGPEDTLTRAMAAQMLWALEGKPVVNYLMQYGDVAQGAWYAEAVRWASAQGVMSGYSGETFGPEDNITREQLALILFNYADQAGYDVDGRADLSGCADEAAVSGWAVTALEWAVDAGLISGREGSALAPAATATRAEVAQIFMNFLENVAK